MRVTVVRAVLTPLSALALSACLGGLLGGGKPVQTYRFGGPPGGAAQGPSPAATRTIKLAPPDFAEEASTARLLASRGSQTLYLKGAAWTAEAPALFAAALHDAFRRRAPQIALVDRRDGPASAALLRVGVMRFEARYDSADKDAVPTIHIEGQATLTDARGDASGARYRFVADQPAASGRIDDIVAAFDAADSRVVDAIADWVAGS